MPSQNDLGWERYLAAKGLQLDGAHFVVLAEELGRLAGREPRLMAKFDEPDQVPRPLARAGYTLLPVRNGQYILFPGDLFVPVQSCTNHQAFTSNTPFRLETAGRGQGESQYIDQAYNIGVLLHGRQRYNRSTITRRRQTIVAWVRWLAQQFACFEERGDEFGLA